MTSDSIFLPSQLQFWENFDLSLIIVKSCFIKGLQVEVNLEKIQLLLCSLHPYNVFLKWNIDSYMTFKLEVYTFSHVVFSF